jgi:hypothetical protein
MSFKEHPFFQPHLVLFLIWISNFKEGSVLLIKRISSGFGAEMMLALLSPQLILGFSFIRRSC